MASASGGGLTDEQIEGRLNRLESRRSTNFNAVSALVVGVITALATLGGVWLGTSQTADAEDASADEDFAREQRIEVYGDFLGNIDKGMNSIEPFLPGPPERGNALAENLTPPTTEQLNEINESVTSVQTLAGRISVISGPEATALAAALMKDVQQGQKVASIIYDCHNQYIGNPRSLEPIRKYFPQPETQEYTFAVAELFRDHRRAFLEQVREDLGLPD